MTNCPHLTLIAIAIALSGCIWKETVRTKDPYRIDITDIGPPCANAIADDDENKDDAPAIRCALNKLRGTGGVVYVPPGVFRISSSDVLQGTDIVSGLFVGPRTTLEGAGVASVLVQSAPLTTHMVTMQRFSTLRRIQLQQQQSTTAHNWQPIKNDYQIRVAYDDVLIQDVLMLNPTKGIQIQPPSAEAAVGRVRIQNLKGEPMASGILLDNVLDVVQLEDIQFWPFWSEYIPSIKGIPSKWRFDTNATAIESRRCDNPVFSGIFALGWGTLLHLSQSPEGCAPFHCGPTSKAKISDLECDSCSTGILVDADNTRGIVASRILVAGAYSTGMGIIVNANNASMLISEGEFTHLAGNAVRVSGARTTVGVVNTLVRDWACRGEGFPAFELVGGSTSNADTVFRVSNSWAGANRNEHCANPNVQNHCNFAECDVFSSKTGSE